MSEISEKKAVIATVQKLTVFAQLLLFVSWVVSVVISCFAENVGFAWFLFNFMGGVALGVICGIAIFNIGSMVEKIQDDRYLDAAERVWYDRFKRWSGSSTKTPS